MKKLLTVITLIAGLMGGTASAMAEAYPEHRYGDDLPQWAQESFVAPE